MHCGVFDRSLSAAPRHSAVKPHERSLKPRPLTGRFSSLFALPLLLSLSLAPSPALSLPLLPTRASNLSCQLTPHELYLAHQNGAKTARFLDMVQINAATNISGLSMDEHVGFLRETGEFEEPQVSDVCVAATFCRHRNTIYDMNAEKGGQFFPRYISIQVCIDCQGSNFTLGENKIAKRVEKMECPRVGSLQCHSTSKTHRLYVLKRNESTGGWELNDDYEVTYGCSCNES